MLKTKNIIISISIAIAISIVVTILVGIFFLNSSYKTDTNIGFVDDNKYSDTKHQVIVYITGEINFPGIYEVDKNSLLINLIELAGGFTKNADTSNLNLVREIISNETIRIPKVINSENFNTTSSLININNATISELTKLPGIGEAIANKIIAYRNSNGYFSKIEDIKKVSGIKDALFEQIKEYICV